MEWWSVKRVKGIRSEGSRNEKRGLFTKIHLWNCWVTRRVKLQTSSLSPPVSSSPTSPNTKTHSLFPLPPSPNTHLMQSKRTLGAGRRMRHIVTPHQPCGIVIGCAFVIQTHKNKPDRTKQGERNPSIYLKLNQQIAGLSVRWCVFVTSQIGIMLLWILAYVREKRRLKISCHFNSHSLWSQMVFCGCGHNDVACVFILFLQCELDAMKFPSRSTYHFYMLCHKTSDSRASVWSAG